MIPTTKAIGPRQLLQLLPSPPRGTPSRVLSARLRRFPRHHRLLSTTALTRTLIQPPSSNGPCPARRFSQSRILHYSATRAAAYAPDADSPHAQLADLLKAVQSQDTTRIWKRIGRLARHQRPIEVADALHKLSPAAFSEIVRSLDPSRVGPNSDATHGLRIHGGLGQFSSVASVADQFGVRKIYKDVFQSLRFMFDLWSYHGSNPSLSDYMVLLRCAGAASDVESAREIWHKAMKTEGTVNPRDGLAYAEYFKARFLTDLTFMQNDLARVRVRPRNLHGNRKRFTEKSLLWPLERMRLSIVASKRTGYGRARWQPTHDMHRLLSLPAPVRRLQAYVARERKVVDEEFYCAYLVASARAGSLQDMIKLLWRTWRIKVTDLRDHRASEIVGIAQNRRLDPLLQPTERLLNAVVHSFGCTGHVILARKLVDFISRQHQVPIPASTWSSLLEWTYIHSSAPAATEWRILRDANRIIRADDVLSVWETMTSEPFLVNVGLKETDIYIKSLISAGRLDEAWGAMKLSCTEYDSLCKEVEEALFETLYPSPPASSITRYQRLKARQHTTWYTIQNWGQQWLRGAGNRLRHDARLSSLVITQFVGEFYRFLPDPITYSTSGGTVRIKNKDTDQRTQWKARTVPSQPTQRLAPDPGRPKYAKSQNASEDEQLIPVLTESGEPTYESMAITIRRVTKKMVRQRRQVQFGQQEKALRSQKAVPGDETEAEEVGAVEAGAVQRLLQKNNRLDTKAVLSALTW